MATRKSPTKAKPPGQKTKAEYDPAIFDALVERWRATHHKRAAAASAGISEDALASYLRRGAEGEQPFADFAERWKRAESDWVTERELYIRKAFVEGGQWQAAAWDLERHLPDEFGKKERLGLGQDPTAGPVQVGVSIVDGLHDPTARAAALALERALASAESAGDPGGVREGG